MLCLKEFGKGQKFYGEALLSSFKSTMLVKAHSIEKGLGLKNAQSGHSSKQVLDLLNRLDKCIRKNYSADDFFFAESFRVISAYIDFQKKFDTSDFLKFGEIEKKYDLLCEKLGKSYVKNNYLNYRAGALSSGNITTRSKPSSGLIKDLSIVTPTMILYLYSNRCLACQNCKDGSTSNSMSIKTMIGFLSPNALLKKF